MNQPVSTMTVDVKILAMQSTLVTTGTTSVKTEPEKIRPKLNI